MEYQSMWQNLLNLVEIIIKDVLTPAIETLVSEDPVFEQEQWVVELPGYNEAPFGFLSLEDINNEGIEVECFRAKNSSFISNYYHSFTIPWSWIDGDKTVGEMRQETIDILSKKMNNRRKAIRESDRRRFERLKEEYGW